MAFRRTLVCLALLIVVQVHAGHPAAAQPAGGSGEVISLITKDGVQLKATYFPSATRKGNPQAKQVTPVVLLHDYKSTQAVFAPLAQKLQTPAEGDNRPSFAAITVDLRAHGGSTKQLLANGAQADLDAAKLSKEGLFAMASLDMEAVRNFLVDKNDAGELNLNKLCLVGSGMGASVAANWALQDWGAPPLAVGKQGQDVKAIALISPRWSYNGLLMQAPMKFRPLKENVAWLLMCGAQDPKAKADVARIQKQLDRYHPATDQGGAQRRSGLVVVDLQSKLQADSLLSQMGAPFEDQIVKFLVENAADTQQPWISRRNRLP